MKFRTENKYIAAFSYASLTDVVLQLLIFFLLSSAYVIQSGIRVQLPRAVAGEQGTKSQIVVSLTDRGTLFLNNEPTSKESLGPKLSALLRSSAAPVVVINADATVSLQQAVEIMDIAKAAGGVRFLIATQPSKQE
ncbi:MAG: biopolymer transporter ExbD [Bacteroidota bacterium]